MEEYKYKDECFYDNQDEAEDDIEDAEALHLDEAAGNYPMERSGAQRTIQYLTKS